MYHSNLIVLNLHSAHVQQKTHRPVRKDKSHWNTNLIHKSCCTSCVFPLLCLRPCHTTHLSNSSIKISRHACTTGHVEGQYLKFQGILLKTPVGCDAIFEKWISNWKQDVAYIDSMQICVHTESTHTHIYIYICMYVNKCIQYVFMYLQLRRQTFLFCFRTVLPWHEIFLYT